jgi:hypothetical protein
VGSAASAARLPPLPALRRPVLVGGTFGGSFSFDIFGGIFTCATMADSGKGKLKTIED